MKTQFKFFSSTFFKINRQYTLTGVGVGIMLCIIRSVINNKLMSTRSMLINIMFSTVISLSITNSIFLSQRLFLRQKINLWQFVVLYYCCNLLGMFIGIELSYMLVALIYHSAYIPLSHFNDYRFTFVVVLIVGTVIYYYNAQKSNMNARLKEKELDLARIKQLKTQAELQTLQSKINPHFLYNSLNSIASLIHEDADKAEDMTLKLSKLFRYSINSQQENMARVKDEMEIVNTYLDIEKVRFGDRITFSSSVDEQLPDKRIPRFLIQPLVENALKHGLNNIAQNGILNVNLRLQNQRMIIEVVDNGQPFPTELSMGYGMQSTYDKLNLLYGDDYEMQLINTPLKCIFISLPLTNTDL